MCQCCSATTTIGLKVAEIQGSAVPFPNGLGVPVPPLPSSSLRLYFDPEFLRPIRAIRAIASGGISMPSIATSWTMDDRARDTIVDGSANAIGKLAGMFKIERDAVWSEMQRAANQVWPCATAINREQVELEEMPVQAFDNDPLGRVGGHHVGELVDCHFTHGRRHRASAHCRVWRNGAAQDIGGLAACSASRELHPRATGFCHFQAHRRMGVFRPESSGILKFCLIQRADRSACC